MKYKTSILILLFPLVIIACEKRHIPTVTTAGVTEITDSSGLSGGNVITDGGAMVATKGVCWNTSMRPTLDNKSVISGNDTGTFFSRMRFLIPGTTYYVRAFATNTIGTAYGNEVSFTTLSSK